MKKILRFLILLISLAVISCGPKKNMIYMDKVDYNQEIKQAQYNGSLIQVGDELNIQITGYDELAIKPFNINTISNANTFVNFLLFIHNTSLINFYFLFTA